MFRYSPFWSKEHSNLFWGDVLPTKVSVLWCLWQEIWTVLNTSRYCMLTYGLLLPGSLAENNGTFKMTVPQFTDLLKPGSEGMTFHLFLAATEPRPNPIASFCGMCWKILLERTSAASVLFLISCPFSLLPTIHCLTFSSCQDDVSKFRWWDTPNTKVITQTLR